jgi:hypothetical protein
VVGGIVALLVLVSSVIVAIAETSCVDGKPYLCPSAFKPAPKQLLTDGQIEFNRLGDSKLSLVRITPARAVRIANAEYGRVHGARIVLESLGGYIDKDAIVHDWVGTRSWVPKAIPAYLVRISGLKIASLGPTPGVVKNHSWNVIVNATNGKIITAITYD